MQYNLSLIFSALGMKTLVVDWGTDLDRWYPLPRQLVYKTRFLLRHRKEREHHQRSLDAVRERYGVRCGPLPVGQGVTRAE